jgi:SOS-response transcriptional repressor LexA
MSGLSERLFRLQRALGLKQKDALAKELGVSRTMLYNYERNDPPPPNELLSTLVQLEVTAGIEQPPITLGADPIGSAKERTLRHVPIVGWAHAGDAENYEELPHSWQDQIATDCRDGKAFAVRLVGDSMEPYFYEGDLLILTPSREIYNGCLAVVRLANDGVTFRRIETRNAGETIRLVPLNPRYEHQDLKREEISWAYPLFGMFRQVCKS